uniref:EGF-like domain-containing protein n=1 Tax=Knipowitschia caucasica TaxID=637954 RepID=A0AAV2LMQ3_KNICA
MPPRKRKKRSNNGVVLTVMFVLHLCRAQVISEDNPSPSDQGSGRKAFFALRSCHQVLGGDTGTFFSPDYLCSNPPLWCNWTIQVHPGKRIQLELADLTPDADCEWRRDQIHIDELHAQSQKHSLLQKCWREASYTSTSNTVHVVLLIEGSPTPPYRGFHAQYQAFGPPPEPDSPPPEPTQTKDNSRETEATDSQTEEGTSEDEMDMGDATLSTDLERAEIALQSTEEPLPEFKEESRPRVGTAIRRDAETDTATDQSEREAVDQSDDSILKELEEEILDQMDPERAEEGGQTSATEEPVLGKTEPQFDPRADSRYLLFEVSVEVNVSRNAEPWNEVAQTLLLSVKNMLINQLKPSIVSQTISSKRIKRLNSGVLFILWLQIGQMSSGRHVHELVHSSLLRLIGFRPGPEDSVVLSLSTADVNECDSQLTVCDPNADCVNHFGSYTCVCRGGFHDQSRTGTGTLCVGDNTTPDCPAPLSSEAKAVFVLFFLLSALVMSLLVLIGLFYHRHRRGHFLVPDSDPNNNNNNHHHSTMGSSGRHVDVDRPPPPPPRCPPVDLQLLRYNAILSHEPKL